MPPLYCFCALTCALLHMQAANAAKIVVVMGTECYDGREKRYADYPATDLLQMVGMAGQAVDSGK